MTPDNLYLRSVNMCRLSGCHLCPRCWAWFARIYTSRVCGPCLPPQLRPSFGCHPASLPKRSGRNHRTNRMQPTPGGALGLSLKSLVVSRFRSGVADPGRSVCEMMPGVRAWRERLQQGCGWRSALPLTPRGSSPFMNCGGYGRASVLRSFRSTLSADRWGPPNQSRQPRPGSRLVTMPMPLARPGCVQR